MDAINDIRKLVDFDLKHAFRKVDFVMMMLLLPYFVLKCRVERKMRMHVLVTHARFDTKRHKYCHLFHFGTHLDQLALFGRTSHAEC